MRDGQRQSGGGAQAVTINVGAVNLKLDLCVTEG